VDEKDIKAHAGPISVGTVVLAIIAQPRHPVLDFFVKDFDAHPAVAVVLAGAIAIVVMIYIRKLKEKTVPKRRRKPPIKVVRKRK
jgi:hypothetical protein